MFGPAGQIQLNEMGLGRNYTIRVESLRDLIDIYDREIVMLEGDIHRHLRHHRGYQVVQAINDVGRTIAAIVVADFGHVTRFPTPRHLCLWAGLTPGRRESDVGGHEQGITKHGSKLLRWALIEGISATAGLTPRPDWRRAADAIDDRYTPADAHAACRGGRRRDGRRVG
jgi:transposase